MILNKFEMLGIIGDILKECADELHNDIISPEEAEAMLKVIGKITKRIHEYN